MADWRQIRARIRRAKAGPDAAARLEQLFDKTRDGMVAFELAVLEEQAGRLERAIDWYKHAWQRFRRSEWKQKAEEALGRHGVPLPAAEESAPDGAPEDADVTASAAEAAEPATESAPETPSEAEPETPAPELEQEGAAQPVAAEAETPQGEEGELAQNAAPEAQATAGAPGHPRRRRHRGGRGRGRKKRLTEGAAPAESAPETATEPPAPPPIPSRRTSEPERRPAEPRPARERLPAVHIYRRGEPALASEIKALEAKLRQLLAAPPHLLGELNELPANPGVFLVSDVDLTTTYYLEACGNMRSAMDQLVSGRRGRQGAIRSKLGKYLGISDTQAGRYLKQHCVARWLDLEESDSNALGHFARAVLRPELMEDSD